MTRKLTAACLALVACIAFAGAPASAFATNDPEVTHPTGTLLGVGTKFSGTNVGNIVFTNSSGNIIHECSTATLTGALTKNDGNNVEAVISSLAFTGTGVGGACTSSSGNLTFTFNPATNGLPWCLRSTSTMATDEFQIRGNECSKLARPIRFVIDISAGGTCTYQRTAAIQGTYKTHPEDAVLSISKVELPLLEGSILCPSSTFLDMSLTLETDTTESADPLYIS